MSQLFSCNFALIKRVFWLLLLLPFLFTSSVQNALSTYCFSTFSLLLKIFLFFFSRRLLSSSLAALFFREERSYKTTFGMQSMVVKRTLKLALELEADKKFLAVWQQRRERESFDITFWFQTPPLVIFSENASYYKNLLFLLKNAKQE